MKQLSQSTWCNPLHHRSSKENLSTSQCSSPVLSGTTTQTLPLDHRASYFDPLSDSKDKPMTALVDSFNVNMMDTSQLAMEFDNQIASMANAFEHSISRLRDPPASLQAQQLEKACNPHQHLERAAAFLKSAAPGGMEQFKQPPWQDEVNKVHTSLQFLQHSMEVQKQQHLGLVQNMERRLEALEEELHAHKSSPAHGPCMSYESTKAFNNMKDMVPCTNRGEGLLARDWSSTQAPLSSAIAQLQLEVCILSQKFDDLGQWSRSSQTPICKPVHKMPTYDSTDVKGIRKYCHTTNLLHSTDSLLAKGNLMQMGSMESLLQTSASETKRPHSVLVEGRRCADLQSFGCLNSSTDQAQLVIVSSEDNQYAAQRLCGTSVESKGNTRN